MCVIQDLITVDICRTNLADLDTNIQCIEHHALHSAAEQGHLSVLEILLIQTIELVLNST